MLLIYKKVFFTTPVHSEQLFKFNCQVALYSLVIYVVLAEIPFVYYCIVKFNNNEK